MRGHNYGKQQSWQKSNLGKKQPWQKATMTGSNPNADKLNSSADNQRSTPSGSIKPRWSIAEAYLQNQAMLRGYISRFLVSSHEIDDVSQETFLRAYNAEQKKTIEEPKAFLFRIAKNLMLSEFKKTSRKITDYIEDAEHEEFLDERVNLVDSIMAQQKLGIYCEAVATLPPKRRRVVLMKKVYGMSHKEIARRMGTTVSAVEKHLLIGGKQCLAVMAERYPDMDSVGQASTESHTGKGECK